MSAGKSGKPPRGNSRARNTRSSINLRTRRDRMSLAFVIALILVASGVVLAVVWPTDAPASDKSQPTRTCVLQRQIGECRTIVLGSGATVRYALLRTVPATAATVTVDMGGPGLSLFGDHWPAGIRQAMPASMSGDNLLLLEEPWVTRPYEGPCRDSARAYFTAVHSAQTPDARTVGTACGLDARGSGWGWSPALYDEALRTIGTDENISLEGFLGTSFGAQRLLYMSKQPQWTVLISPAPKSVDAGAYLGARHDAALSGLTARCSACAKGRVPLSALRTAARSLDAQPAVVPSRSVPVTGADVGAAVVALTYQADDMVPKFWTALEKPAEHAKLIGALADTVWSRFGVDDVSPAWLAYLSEVCAAFPGWDRALSGMDPTDPVAYALAAYHGPCRSVPAAAPPVRVQYSARFCVVATAGDTVTPQSFTGTWRDVPHLKVVEKPGTQHASYAQASECFSDWSS